MNKIDFAVVFSVKNANPNGDPSALNRPRTQGIEEIGMVSSGAIKRKMRNRFHMDGERILIHPSNDPYDGASSIVERIKKSGVRVAPNHICKDACKTFFDVRAFGGVCAVKNKSFSVTGPVTIQNAYSLNPVEIVEMGITKCLNTDGKKSAENTDAAASSETGDPEKKGSDTMGTKYYVSGLNYYTFYGSINPHIAKATGLSDKDVQKIKNALVTLFEGDATAARPDGSMEVIEVIWWEHSCPAGDASAAKVHRSLNVSPDGEISVKSLDFPNKKSLVAERIRGF